jgi:hypothetical protein
VEKPAGRTGEFPAPGRQPDLPGALDATSKESKTCRVVYNFSRWSLAAYRQFSSDPKEKVKP